MATSNNAGQTSQDVNYHKRIAMGANLDGSSLGGGDSAPRSNTQKVDTTNRRVTRTGGLSQASKK